MVIKYELVDVVKDRNYIYQIRSECGDLCTVVCPEWDHGNWRESERELTRTYKEIFDRAFAAGVKTVYVPMLGEENKRVPVHRTMDALFNAACQSLYNQVCIVEIPQYYIKIPLHDRFITRDSLSKLREAFGQVYFGRPRQDIYMRVVRNGEAGTDKLILAEKGTEHDKPFNPQTDMNFSKGVFLSPEVTWQAVKDDSGFASNLYNAMSHNFYEPCVFVMKMSGRLPGAGEAVLFRLEDDVTVYGGDLPCGEYKKDTILICRLKDGCGRVCFKGQALSGTLELTFFSERALLNTFQGCIIGGAAGDALGYPVEFMTYKEIIKEYGSSGIRKFDLSALRSQNHNSKNPPYTNEVPTMDKPCNDSKGCGGVMRVAPLGLMLSSNHWIGGDGAMVTAGQAAAITHGHPLGYLPAAFLGELIHRITYRMDGSAPLLLIIKRTLEAIDKKFHSTEYLSEFDTIIQKAIALAETENEKLKESADTEEYDELTARSRINDVINIHAIGGGWVGEEALAIAIYCVIRYPEDFQEALRISVNHSGDSDSTGSITGNILGAYLGLERIKEQISIEEEDPIQIEKLELYDSMHHWTKQAFQVVINTKNNANNSTTKKEYEFGLDDYDHPIAMNRKKGKVYCWNKLKKEWIDQSYMYVEIEYGERTFKPIEVLEGADINQTVLRDPGP